MSDKTFDTFYYPVMIFFTVTNAIIFYSIALENTDNQVILLFGSLLVGFGWNLFPIISPPTYAIEVLKIFEEESSIGLFFFFSLFALLLYGALLLDAIEKLF